MVRAFVVSGGATRDSVACAHLPDWPDAFVVAADGGWHAAQHLGIPTTVLVGDFDSIDPEALTMISRDDVAIERHSADKDATDLELALLAAIARGATDICVIDAMRGRVDHFLATMLLLASPRFAACAVTACIDTARLIFVPPKQTRVVDAVIDTTISLLALHDVERVTTTGLRWPLSNTPLLAGTTLGVSNIATDTAVIVHNLTGPGTILVLQPGEQ